MTELQLLLALHLQAQRLRVLPACVPCWGRSDTQPSPDGSALGSLLKSRSAEMARGALMGSGALARVMLTLGEFTALFAPSGPILQPRLVLPYFPFFSPKALQAKYLDNRMLNLCVHSSSEVLVCRSPGQH